MKSECLTCDGEGLVDFTDEEWVAKYGVPMSEYRFTGKEPETMKACPECGGKGFSESQADLVKLTVEVVICTNMSKEEVHKRVDALLRHGTIRDAFDSAGLGTASLRVTVND